MQNNRVHLTPRLRTIMEQVPAGAHLADIGTDHALIPTALLRQGRITSAIASDIRTGPLNSAARTAEQFGLEADISLRLGPGLSTVQPEECDTIVIAGMGGETIAQILDEAPWALDGNHLLLLQAMTAQPQLRQYLAAHGGAVRREALCREGQRIYTVMVVRGGAGCASQTLSDCCISEAMLRDPLAEAYLAKQLARERSICASLEKARVQKPEELALHRETIQVLCAAADRLRKE